MLGGGSRWQPLSLPWDPEEKTQDIFLFPRWKTDSNLWAAEICPRPWCTALVEKALANLNVHAVETMALFPGWRLIFIEDNILWSIFTNEWLGNENVDPGSQAELPVPRLRLPQVQSDTGAAAGDGCTGSSPSTYTFPLDAASLQRTLGGTETTTSSGRCNCSWPSSSCHWGPQECPASGAHCRSGSSKMFPHSFYISKCRAALRP